MSYYEILGVRTDASQEDIKRAFRRLAMQLHPDKSRDPEAEGKFRLVYIAYDILHDIQKREIYDWMQSSKQFAGGEEEEYDEYEDRRYRRSSVKYWQQHADLRAEYFSRMQYQDFEDTMMTRFNFHSRQVAGFLMSFIILVVGFIMILVGGGFVFNSGFNGSITVAIVFLVAGGAMAVSGARSLLEVFKTWNI